MATVATVAKKSRAEEAAEPRAAANRPHGESSDDEGNDDAFQPSDGPDAKSKLPLLNNANLTCPLCEPRDSFAPLRAAPLLQHLLMEHHVTVAEVDQLVDLQVCSFSSLLVLFPCNVLILIFILINNRAGVFGPLSERRDDGGRFGTDTGPHHYSCPARRRSVSFARQKAFFFFFYFFF